MQINWFWVGVENQSRHNVSTKKTIFVVDYEDFLFEGKSSLFLKKFFNFWLFEHCKGLIYVCIILKTAERPQFFISSTFDGK